MLIHDTPQDDQTTPAEKEIGSPNPIRDVRVTVEFDGHAETERLRLGDEEDPITAAVQAAGRAARRENFGEGTAATVVLDTEDLLEIDDLLKQIEALCENPHFTATRRWTILHKASAARLVIRRR